MNDLSIINRGGVAAVDSREVAEWVGKEHYHLLRDIKGYAEALSTEPNFGLSDFFIETTYKDSTGRTLPNYLITRKGCEMVANKLRGQKGVIFTAKYIECFHEYENALKLPQDYPSALRALADSYEKQEALAAQNAAMLPKVEFYDDVVESKSAIDMAAVAKTLHMGVGRNKLFEVLRTKGVLQANNQPYQRYIDLGWFRCIESKFNLPDGSVKIRIKTVVFQKGVDGIRKLLKAA